MGKRDGSGVVGSVSLCKPPRQPRATGWRRAAPRYMWEKEVRTWLRLRQMLFWISQRRTSGFRHGRKTYALADVAGENGTVVVFICNTAPMSKAVIDRLVADAAC